MARRTKEQLADAKFDQGIEAVYYRLCKGRAISVMDIGKLFADVRADFLKGVGLEHSVEQAIQRYEVKP